MLRKKSVSDRACLDILQESAAVPYLQSGFPARKDTKMQINKKNPAVSSAFYIA
jgi:hypothetical protein